MEQIKIECNILEQDRCNKIEYQLQQQNEIQQNVAKKKKNGIIEWDRIVNNRCKKQSETRNKQGTKW